MSQHVKYVKLSFAKQIISLRNRGTGNKNIFGRSHVDKIEHNMGRTTHIEHLIGPHGQKSEHLCLNHGSPPSGQGTSAAHMSSRPCGPISFRARSKNTTPPEKESTLDEYPPNTKSETPYWMPGDA